MTMWERMLELTRRVSALEERLERFIDETESKFEPDDVVDTLLREVNSLDRLVCGRSEDELGILDRLAALEADAKKARPPVVNPVVRMPSEDDSLARARVAPEKP